jgi:hypothetical protein
VGRHDAGLGRKRLDERGGDRVGMPRVYAASVRRTGGFGRSTRPENRGGMTLAGTSTGPSPAAARIGAVAVCSVRTAALGWKPASAQALSRIPMTHVKMPAYGVSLTQMFLPALSAAGVVV